MSVGKSGIVLTFLALSCAAGQFRYSAGAGLAVVFPAPDMEQFNSTLSDSGLNEVSPFWVPTAVAISVQAYPSLRLGYLRYSNLLLKNRSSENWALTISMVGLSVESFFSFLKRFEANFGFSPMLAKADFSQTETTAQGSPFGPSSSAGIQHRSMAYVSWVGLRFYLNSLVALEATTGYLNLTFKGDGWKSEGQETAIQGKIDMSRPMLAFGIVVGW
ncbi:MAG: hypothetical protein ACE5HZ_07990 [Fidelibacterota bacterium]